MDLPETAEVPEALIEESKVLDNLYIPAADPSRAQKELGWRPRSLGLTEVVETAWKWQRSRG